MKNKDLIKNRKEKGAIRCLLLAFGLIFLSGGLTGCKDRREMLLAGDAVLEEGEAFEEPEGLLEEEDPSFTGQQPSSFAEQDEKEPVLIWVDVDGAVKSPGVYCLEEDSRVYQALEAAGGCLPQAALSYLNRAGRLEDGQKVYVPSEEEMKEAGTSIPGDPSKGELLLWGGESAPEDDRININTADEKALTALAGIGPARAQAIVAYREKNGPFSQAEEIMNVEGIKEGTFSKIKDKITV